MEGLTDLEIKHNIRDGPKKMKKRTKTLRRKLEKLGVKLGPDGIADFSSIKNPEVL